MRALTVIFLHGIIWDLLPDLSVAFLVVSNEITRPRLANNPHVPTVGPNPPNALARTLPPVEVHLTLKNPHINPLSGHPPSRVIRIILRSVNSLLISITRL